MKGSDYEDKWSQWANDMGRMSNHKKRKEKSEKKRIGANCNRNLVACLCVAIYGSKQGVLKWYQWLWNTLKDLGFVCIEANWRVFVATIVAHILILTSHVNNCTITGDLPSLIKVFKDKIETCFGITELVSYPQNHIKFNSGSPLSCPPTPEHFCPVSNQDSLDFSLYSSSFHSLYLWHFCTRLTS